MIPEEITNDLRKGKGLEETLIDHNTNLKILFSGEKRNYPKPINRRPLNTEWMHIYENDSGNFSVRKEVKRVKVHFGCYKKFDDAKKVRDRLIDVDWNQDMLDTILLELGISRNPRGGYRRKKE